MLYNFLLLKCGFKGGYLDRFFRILCTFFVSIPGAVVSFVQRNLPAAPDKAEDKEKAGQRVDAFHGRNLPHRITHTITKSFFLKSILVQLDSTHCFSFFPKNGVVSSSVCI